MTVEEMLGPSWFKRIGDEFNKPYMEILHNALMNSNIYPDPNNIFRAFKETPYEDVRIVLIGQDPYHDGQATGLCFETKGKMNTSLRKILDGMDEDLGIGDYLTYQHELGYLANRGVLMLNSALTVEPGKPGVHMKMWEPFTKRVLEELSKRELCYLVWGQKAEKVVQEVDPFYNLVLKAEHPAAAGYQGRPWHHNRCFSQARDYVRKNFDEKFTF